MNYLPVIKERGCIRYEMWYLLLPLGFTHQNRSISPTKYMPLSADTPPISLCICGYADKRPECRNRNPAPPLLTYQIVIKGLMPSLGEV
jgi:hypothetical protein